MRIEYSGLSSISGGLAAVEGVSGVGYDEVAEFTLPDGTRRHGKVVSLDGGRALLQIFEGTRGMTADTVRTHFTGRPMTLALSPQMLGRSFDGKGTPIDGLGPLRPEERRPISGSAMNPAARIYPKDCILTGISAIDGPVTLIRGQKLPIFSAAGLPHNELAAQIVGQAKVLGQDEPFAIVFAAMGVGHDTAAFFRKSFAESGASGRVVMFLNLTSDPMMERITAPRCALTAAEYLAFTHGWHVLVIMTDMTAYCEAVREFSSSKGEIPSRKGFPAYLYSDLASIYERAGMLRSCTGSVTQMPILTMPQDDITHPVPDLTGYITEGQIVLDRSLATAGIYPPVGVLPSLSRLMKDGIGAGFTRPDHPALSNQLFASYSRVQEAKNLANVIGEDELGDLDRAYLAFGIALEQRFIRQEKTTARTLDETLDLGWELLSLLPPAAWDRVDEKTRETHYKK